MENDKKKLTFSDAMITLCLMAAIFGFPVLAFLIIPSGYMGSATCYAPDNQKVLGRINFQFPHRRGGNVVGDALAFLRSPEGGTAFCPKPDTIHIDTFSNL